MTERLIATEGDLRAARELETTNDLDAMENTIRHLWEKLERLRKEAETREQLFRNAFNLGALEHRRVIELQDRLLTLETAHFEKPRPATPIVYFAVPGTLAPPVKQFLKSLIGPNPVSEKPTVVHVSNRGNFFVTDVEIKRLGTPEWTKVELKFMPHRRDQ